MNAAIEDAVYSLWMSERERVDGSRYVLHFEHANGDRDALTLKYSTTTVSLDHVHPAHQPGPERSSNWLPATAGCTLGITMRLYAPQIPGS